MKKELSSYMTMGWWLAWELPKASGLEQQLQLGRGCCIYRPLQEKKNCGKAHVGGRKLGKEVTG